MKFLFFLIINFYYTTTLFATENKSDTKNYCVKHAHIKKIPVNIRLGPSIEYKVIYATKQSFLPVRVKYEHPDNWCYIDFLNNNIKGWVLCSALSKSTLSLVKDDAVLYRVPNNQKQKIATIKNGTRVYVMQCREDWCQVKIFKKQNITGFINKKYIWNVECIINNNR